MARGDIPTAVKPGNQANKILARTPFEAIPMTIDFTNVSADSEGYYKVAAGTPIGAGGAPMTAYKVNTGTTESPAYAYAVGCLLNDVYKDEPAGAVLTKAYIDCGFAATASGLAYNAAFVADALEANTKVGNVLRFENIVPES